MADGGGGSERQIRQITVKIDTQGSQDLKAIADQFGGLNKKLSSVNSTLNQFKGFLATALAGVGIREIVGLSDEMQNLKNRLTILSGSSKEADKALEGIFDIAQRVHAPISDLAEVFTRVQATTTQAKFSTQSLLLITESLADTFKISGANTEEAKNAQIQFTQALAIGVLRGQDLKSVLSQNILYGELLAKSLGRQRGELLKLAEQGKITAKEALKPLIENSDLLKKSAEQMAATFGQTVVDALNVLQREVGRTNEALGASSAFNKTVHLVIDNIGVLPLILGAAAAAITAVLVPAIAKLGVAIAAAGGLVEFILAPAIAIPAAIGLIVVALAEFIKHFDIIKEVAGIALNYVSLKFNTLDKAIAETYATFLNFIGANENVKKLNSDRIAEDQKRIDSLKEEQTVLLKSREVRSANAKAEALAQAGNLKGDTSLKNKKDLLAELNAEYLKGSITLQTYNNKLTGVRIQQFTRDFIDGKKDIFQFNEEIRKVELEAFNKDLLAGRSTLTEFNKNVEGNKIRGLNEQLAIGKISLLEYDAALVKVASNFLPGSSFRAGTEEYIKSIGTISSQIAQGITKTFSRLEDSFVEFTKTGKFNFNDFAQAVLDDLNRIIIRSLVIAPLAKGLLSSFAPGADAGNSAGGSYGGFDSVSADGNVFGGPTAFGYGSGKLGLLGEAGPEAVMPLTRHSNGKLGVQASSTPVVVNIINNAGAEVQQTEKTSSDGTRSIEVLINSKVKEGISSGAYDRTFQQSFGLNRKGV